MSSRTSWFGALSLLLVAASLAGCGKSNPVATNSTSSRAVMEAQVSHAVALGAPVVEDGLMESADQTAIGASVAGAQAAALIQPLHYWRHITDVERTFAFVFSDTDSTGMPTRAVVTIHKKLAGTFNILFDATPGDSMLFDSVAVVKKPLHDFWERKVLLRRVPKMADDDEDENSPMAMNSHPGDDDEHGGGDSSQVEWRIVGVSGVKVTSFDPANSSGDNLAFGSTKIQSLRLMSASGDTTITEPLDFFRLRHTPAFISGDDVTITATTMTNDDVVVLLRTGFRRRFHNNGDNTYTLTVHVEPEEGLHHFGVNALSHGTLFDDTAPYDSQAWILPFRVKPSDVAATIP